MIKSKFIVASEMVIRDDESGQLSIINILDDFVAESYPIVPKKTFIISFLEQEAPYEEDNKMQLMIFNNDKLLGSNLLTVRFNQLNKTRSVVEVGSFIVPEPGELHFCIFAGDKELDRYTVRLGLRDPIVVQNGESIPQIEAS